MQNPKIVFFDIDDTIYRKYTDTLRPSIGEAMRALKRRGMLTAIATGRPPAAVPAKVRRLIDETGIDMLVTINGQYTEFRGKALQAYPMTETEMADMAAFFDSKGIAYAFVNNNEIAVSEVTEWAVETLQHILPEFLTDREYFRKKPVYQMLAFFQTARDAELADKIAAAGLKTVRWHQNAVDMLRADGSKACGIARAVAELGIDMKDVMAFGDGPNDVEMLQTVGFGVAMDNGDAAAKAVADYICPSVDEDGVFQGLKTLGVIA